MRSAVIPGRYCNLSSAYMTTLQTSQQACGREEECIAVYHRMEANHPSPKMRRQAEHLRFILEAPKLQRSPDEKVKIPILKDIERKCVLRCRTPSSTLRPHSAAWSKHLIVCHTTAHGSIVPHVRPAVKYRLIDK